MYLWERCYYCGHRLRFPSTHCPQCTKEFKRGFRIWFWPDKCECERCISARSRATRHGGSSWPNHFWSYRRIENMGEIQIIARVCHEANRAYCQSIGDDSQVPWNDAPQWQKDSAIRGVLFHMTNPDATPENSHESWLEEKRANGWTYGEVKDAEKKTHPCFRPYAELPQEQRSKDYIFRAIVHAMK